MAHRKTEEERYGDWSEKIRERRAFLNHKQDEWEKYLRYYRMDLTEEEAPIGDTVWLNYFFGLSRVILPSIYYRNPDIMILPRGATPLEYAKMLEDLVGFQIEQMDFEDEMRRIVLDTFFMGLGVMKFGFAPVLRSKARKGTVDAYAEASQSLFDDDLWQASKKRSFFEPDQRISDTDPFAIRVNPKYFLIDPLATTIKDARWVVHCVLKPVDEVKKNKTYLKAVTSGIEGDHLLSDEHFLNEAGSVPGYSEKMPAFYQELVMIYEIWDRETDSLIVMDSWNIDHGDSRFMREEKNPYDIEGFPFDILVFNSDPVSPYGVSDARVLENPIDALNLINSMQYNHVKRFHRKYVVSDELHPDEVAKLESPVDGTVIRSKSIGPGGLPDASSVVHPIVDAPMSRDVYALSDNLRNEITFLSGVTEQRRGGGEKTKTATEASIIEQQARVRDSDRLYLVSKFVERAASRILLLDRQFLDSNYAAFIVGPEALQLWEQKAPEILKAEVDVKVRVGSSAFVSREVKNKQLLDFYNLVRGDIDEFGRPIANKQEFILRIADAMDIDEPEKLLMFYPPVELGGAAPVAAAPGGTPGAAAPQKPALRTGASNLGSQLSGIQNLGVRRTPPSPVGGQLG